MSTRWIAALALTLSAALPQSPPTLLVDGGNGKTVNLTVADLAKLPQHTIQTPDHGKLTSFEGVLLSDLLAKVDLPAGEKLRGKLLASYLIVEAADGFKTVFALPELDPAFTEAKVYLVWKRDGQPLSEKEGPFRTIVPGEKRPSRWVRQVTALKIREGK